MKPYPTLVISLLGACLVIMGISTDAACQSVPDISTDAAAGGAQVSIGAGVGAAPDYEGSNDYDAVIIPFFKIAGENHISVELFGNKVKANLIPSPMWKAGLVGIYISQRDGVDSKKVARLSNVGTSFMLGGFFGFEYANWNASIEAMTDVMDGNDGSLVRLLGGYRIPIDETLSISLGAFTTWADDDYMEAYFKISAADSARSGLKRFNADSGIKDVGLNLTASYRFWENWGLMGLLGYKRLTGDAEDSPVTDDAGDANQFIGGALVTYRF